MRPATCAPIMRKKLVLLRSPGSRDITLISAE